MQIDKRIFGLILFICSLVAVVAVDQATKFGLEGMEKSLFGNFLWVSSVHNEGAAFSMFVGARWWFVGIGAVAFGLILYVVVARKISEDKLFLVAIGLIAGGIIGNIIDRIFFGYVRDFIDFRFSGFAIFNIADSALCIGCAILVLWAILAFVRDSKNKKKKSEDEKNGD